MSIIKFKCFQYNFYSMKTVWEEKTDRSVPILSRTLNLLLPPLLVYVTLM